MSSKLGPLYLVASSTALQGVFWKKQAAPLVKSLAGAEPQLKILAEATVQIEEFLMSKRKKFTLPLDLQGTEFQKQVWAQLQKIPYGKTCSYKELAVLLKRPKACRAVGTANGKNPVSIIIPCHRVVARNGTLGGYAGGLPNKALLLEIESKS